MVSLGQPAGGASPHSRAGESVSEGDKTPGGSGDETAGTSLENVVEWKITSNVPHISV